MFKRCAATILIATAVLVAFGSGQAWAPVPPRDCGTLEVKGKRFNIKSDQVRCRAARRLSRRYLARHIKPRGYSCRTYSRQTAIKFRCSKGVRVLFAIRR